MRRLRIELVTEDRISPASQRSTANLTDTYRYLPGTVIRGAVAAAWIRDHGTPAKSGRRDEFVSLFEQAVLWGPAFVAGSATEPLSVLRCKYRPLPDCRDFGVDLAFESQETFPYCSQCDGPTDLGKGRVLDVPIVDRTRTALENGTAKKGSLFTRRSIERDIRLVGHLIVSDGAPDGPWLEALGGRTIWVGGGRSTSGRVRIDRVEADQPEARNPLPKDEDAVLRLISPAILVDAVTRPLPRFTDDVIGAALGVDVEILRQWVRSDRLGGWHAVAGTPKPQEHVLIPGSTVQFVPHQMVRASVVAGLEAEGLGLRRVEGFGRVAVNPEPWKPAPTADPGAQQPDTAAVEALRGLLDVGLGPDLDWIGTIVKEAAVAVGLGDAPDTDDLLGRRARRLTDTQRQSLEALFRGDGEVLHGVAVLIEDWLGSSDTESDGRDN